MKRMTVVTVLCSCLALGGASWTLAQVSPPGEVSGPLSAQPFTIASATFLGPRPCDSPPTAGCLCCYWATGSESGSTSFNLYRMADLRTLHFGYGFECDQAGLVSNYAMCCEAGPLATGQILGFLVQGVNSAGAGILGTDSLGGSIPAAVACP